MGDKMKKMFTLIIIILFIGCAPSSSEKEIKINPMVKFQGNWLIIRNNDNFSYDYVKLGLNDGSFKKELPISIPPGEQVRYELSSFAKSDGERFNIFKYSLVDITISCEVSKEENKKWVKLGKAFYYGRFK
jgi:hypothetical protein